MQGQDRLNRPPAESPARHPFGTHREILTARAGRAMSGGDFQNGGTVSSLIAFALDNQLIDRALLTDREGLRPLPRNVSMGSGLGLACGFGQLARFGLSQSVVAVCGDSTFFHAVMPALVNAIHNQADCTLIVLDNSGTAMTGFQAHPGLSSNALGHSVPAVDIPSVCRSMGAPAAVCDPFDLETTQDTLLDFLENHRGVRIVVLRQICALSPEKKQQTPETPRVDPELCRGESCGCNRLCTRIFKCPGLIWDRRTGTASIDTIICTGCGNPEILVISNTRPVHPIGVISGEQDYPTLPDIESRVEALSETSWFIPASDQALALGNPVLANAILIGALAGTALLPLHREVLVEVLAKRMDQEKVQANLQAFDAGTGMTRPLQEKAPHT